MSDTVTFNFNADHFFFPFLSHQWHYSVDLTQFKIDFPFRTKLNLILVTF